MGNHVQQHDKYYIYGSRVLSSFAFSVFYSSLVLYLTQYIHFSYLKSSAITGVFLSIHFLMPLPAGFLIDRYFQARTMSLLSAILMTLGSFIIYVGDKNVLFWGLSISMLGSGLTSISTNCYINDKLGDNHANRDSVFYYAYAFMNGGFLVGFVLSGLLDLHQSYKEMFLLCTITSLLRVALNLYLWTKLKTQHEHSLNKAPGYLFLLVFPFIGYLAYLYAELTPALFFTVSVTSLLLVFIWLLYKQQHKPKSKLLIFFLLYLGNLAFWTVYYTGPLGVSIFIKENVQRTIGQITFAPQWLSIVNSVVIVIIAPLLAKMYHRKTTDDSEISIFKQFLLALLLLSMSFELFSIGIFFADSKGFSPLIATVCHFIFQASAEVLIGPIGPSLVARYIDRPYQHIMMGYWMMIYGISMTASSHFSSLMNPSESHNPLISNQAYLNIFNNLGELCISASLLVCLSMFLIKHLSKKLNNSQLTSS